MGIEVFNRYENKYLITEDTFASLQKRITDHMEPDAYNQHQENYAITNIYYDTEDDQLIRTSLQKPRYKEKLRIRAYGVPRGDDMIYVEIKKKVSGLVNKRRSVLNLQDAYSFLATGQLPDIRPYMNRQVLHEVQYILQRHQLLPKLYLAYERKAFFSRDDHDFRLSFDANIITRRNDLKLESGIYGQRLLKDYERLMEVKTSKSIPFWFTRLLSEYRIYPTSFSKYGAEYAHYVQSGAMQQDLVYAPIPVSTKGVLIPA